MSAMRTLARTRRLAVVLVVMAVLGASAAASAAARAVVDARGVPGLRLGATAASLRQHGRIGSLRPGCELNPTQRIAKLLPPLQGIAVFNHRKRRLSALTFAGGVETARGIRIGSTPRQARSAYPRAEYEPPGTADPFAEGFFWVNSKTQPAMTFIVDPNSNRIDAISVHWPSFCE
jgi:hypothetical protein